MSERHVEEHESYGMVGLFRVQGNSGPMFGSSIRHHNFIRLRVCRAKKERDLSTNWYFARDEIVEVDLSPTQFSDMLTCMNVGDGVPCTLRYVNGKRMGDPPSVEQREVFEQEFKNKAEGAVASAEKLVEEARAILGKPSILKADRERLIGMMNRVLTEIRSNMPFVQSCFNEAMDKTVTEAKGEVEAFVQHKILSLGIEALRKQIEDGAGVELIEGKALPE